MLTIACEFTVPQEIDLKACSFHLVGKKESENWYDFVTTVNNKSLYVFVSEEGAKDFLFMSGLNKKGYDVFPVSFAYIQRLIERHGIPYIFVSPPFTFL